MVLFWSRVPKSSMIAQDSRAHPAPRWQYYHSRNYNECRNLKVKIAGAFVVLAAIVLLALYDITFVLDFGGVRTVEAPDQAVEIQFENCFHEKDEALHADAFGTIDNPDVQREVISAGRQRIRRECRALFPQRLIEVEQQSERNLIDLAARFW